jgi:hypothetical protein
VAVGVPPASTTTWLISGDIAYDINTRVVRLSTDTDDMPEDTDMDTGTAGGEIELAVICMQVRYFSGKTVYTYAATGVRDDKSNELLWYLTGSDSPQRMTYEELLAWGSSNGRAIIKMWLATSWQQLV